MIITAFPVGFFAGLFGIGGGLITVPFLFFIFEALGVDQNYLMHLAVGTSFAIIIPTSIVSVYTHNKHKSVDQNIVKTYGLFVIIGSSNAVNLTDGLERSELDAIKAKVDERITSQFDEEKYGEGTRMQKSLLNALERLIIKIEDGDGKGATT